MTSDGRVRTEAVAIRFGRNLRSCRQRADFSQADLSELALLHRSEIGVLERGSRLCRIDTMLRLAGSLSIPVANLLEDIEWIPGRHFEVHDAHDSIRRGLGRTVETLRNSRRISLTDLAIRSELDKYQLEQIERGIFEPTWGEMRRVAKALEVPFPEFCERAERFGKGALGSSEP
jgi:transcriptional regulator with XRE-family HTH domain